MCSALSALRRLTHELIKAYKLPEQQLRMCQCGAQWQPARDSDINRFHTDMYVNFLQQLTCNAADVRDEVTSHIINSSVCFTETAWCARAPAFTIKRLSTRLRMRCGLRTIVFSRVGVSACAL